MNPNRPSTFKTYGNHYGLGHSTVTQGSPEDGELPPFLETAVIRCKTPRIVKPRVLCFTASTGRPSHLMACIRQIQDQTYPCDHAVFLNHPGAASKQDPHNFLGLIRQSVLHPVSNLYLSFGASGRQHYNYMAAVKSAPYHNYHLFLKIDDDDFYSDEYVAECVQDWVANKWDFSGCASEGYMEHGLWHGGARLKSLGLNARDLELGVIHMMPPTYALSAAAMVEVMRIKDDGEHYEDMQWRWAIAGHQSLRMARRNACEFSYQVHNHNFSRPSRAPSPDTGASVVSDTPVWAVGVITAPRKDATLAASVASLQQAGFSDLHIFAEPATVVPRLEGCVVHTNRTVLGPLGNLYHAVSALLATHEDADRVAVFQDDIKVTAGVRQWFEQGWPLNHEIASLYTCGVYVNQTPGWRLLDLGYWRTFGALGFVLSRKMALDFLQDPEVQHTMATHQKAGSDAVFGKWASKWGGIAWHSPSLIAHTGEESTLRPWKLGPATVSTCLDHVSEIATWKPASVHKHVGLVGWNTAQGLGYLNRALVKHLPIHRWIIPTHPRFPELDVPSTVDTIHVPLDADQHRLRETCANLHWMMFCELPYIQSYAGIIRECGTQVACIPMWEWLHEDLDWLKFVDLFICPNQYCYDMLSQWRKKLGYKWDMVMLPWPIDTDDFVFQPRTQCRSFLFNNGTGGGMAYRRDGGRHQPRKGVEVVLHAAKRVPHIPIFLRTQTTELPVCPANVTVLQGEADNLGLYSVGDVAVQPSLYEGLGLQCLESQACGLPLITTNAPPMTEYKAIRTVRCSPTEGRCYGERWIPVYLPDPEDLAKHMSELFESDISQASAAARAFIEEEHSWKTATDKFLKLIF